MPPRIHFESSYFSGQRKPFGSSLNPSLVVQQTIGYLVSFQQTHKLGLVTNSAAVVS